MGSILLHTSIYFVQILKCCVMLNDLFLGRLVFYRETIFK